MSYVDSILMPNERILYQTKLHWIIYVPGLSSAFLGLVFTLIAPELGLFFLILGCAITFIARMNQITTEIAVTSRRIISKTGWISRETMEMNLDQVESVRLSQTIFGRMLDYGTIDVLGTGSGIEGLDSVDSPLALRKMIQGHSAAARTSPT